jgi:protein-disulfide isomerase
VTGNKESKVVLIEYSDFQCPACAFYHPIVQSILKEFGDRIQFVYRHFPLKSLHANAQRAAFAAEAAGKQGKFWEMQSLLFERQGDWKESNDIKTIFESYASSLSLDIEKFRSDFSSDAVEEKVDRDAESAIALDVNSTPTFFLNGQKIKSPLGYDQLRSLIQNALDGTL